MKKQMMALVLVCLLFCVAALSGCSKGMVRTETPEGIFYHDKSGIPLCGWLTDGQNRYFLNNQGRACTGFQEIGAETYYFGEDGVMVTGWVDREGSRCFFQTNGTMAKGWLTLDGAQYFLNADGTAATGICRIADRPYLFDSTGKLTRGWLELGDALCYGDSSGRPLTGWQEIEGKRYYFEDSGLLRTGWVKSGGFTYYYHEDGSPAQGYCTVDGKLYTFSANGQLLELVNPWTPIREDYTVDLTPIDSDHRIATAAYQDYLEMMADCTAAGMQPVVCSSYRTHAYQSSLFQNKVNRVLDSESGYTTEEAEAVAAMSVAVPGTSEHQLGLAIDIVDNRNWNLDESQADMPTQKWLMENSWRYGWILRYPNEKSAVTGIIYEPWHYRYVGREVAAQIHDWNVCLEEYLLMITPSAG